MKKIMFFMFLSALIIVTACDTQNNSDRSNPCTEEAKLCPDGSAVVRMPPNCEFAECPKENKTPIKEIVELCEAENPEFNANEECQKLITQEYPNRQCTFELENAGSLPLGSCRNCIIECQKEGCDYNGESKKYVGKRPDECSRIRFVCEQTMEYFEDDCGCGCKPKEGELQQNYCTPEQKKADVCIEIYKPVCGWSDPEKIQCVRYPCAQTYSNSCNACADENVLYWTEGECPT